ncbi:LmeA family phospholipid-binding protein [Mycobacterium sp.]|uniref:LmeA family phospholipid-binding protein n=1 Tax=Mycobacterium sp. TaxID=1785 RepID=UPI0025F75DF1|nr:LmeA family phospholipid-binding protein [Mycobacterium sp.]MBW0012133.1 LmeA family phospholipid-binding protein [Mycobacterium sp.]
MTNPQGPQGPPNEGPSTWARPGNHGPFGPPPTERPTERISTGGHGQAPRPPVAAPQSQPTEQLGPPRAGMHRAGYTSSPTPPANPAEQVAAPNAEPAPVKRKRRFLRDPLSILLICIIVFSLLIAGLVGAELYARHVANSKVAQAVACEVKDQATASFGVTPLVLWQQATKHFTNISVQTAGNQLRDAKGMKLSLNIKDVRLNSTPTSKGTIGSLDATITWTSDGIKQSVQNAIPVLGPFVTNSVITHPSDGTVELKGMLDNITAKPVVSGNGLELQIMSFNALGFTMPRESVQSTLDDFLSNQTKNFPLGIHADSVQVTSSGVTSHFSTQNATIPNGNNNNPCFANL